MRDEYTHLQTLTEAKNAFSGTLEEAQEFKASIEIALKMLAQNPEYLRQAFVYDSIDILNDLFEDKASTGDAPDVVHSALRQFFEFMVQNTDDGVYALISCATKLRFGYARANVHEADNFIVRALCDVAASHGFQGCVADAIVAVLPESLIRLGKYSPASVSSLKRHYSRKQLMAMENVSIKNGLLCSDFEL